MTDRPASVYPGTSADALGTRLYVLLAVGFVLVALGASFFGFAGTVGGLCLGSGVLEAGMGEHIPAPARSGALVSCVGFAVLALLLI